MDVTVMLISVLYVDMLKLLYHNPQHYPLSLMASVFKVVDIRRWSSNFEIAMIVIMIW